MLKKSLVSFIALMMVLALLAGCGAQPANNAGNASGNTTNSANTADNTANNNENSSSPDAWAPVTVTDDLGRSITIEKKPEAVAALIGSFADTWVLAGGELKAAVNDAWEDFELPLGEDVVNLGKYNTVSLEQIFSSGADLVIASGNTKKQVEFKETLEKSGVNALYFNVNSFEDYLRMLKVCTDITGRADLYEKNGTVLAAQIEEIKKLAEKKASEQGAPKVLFIRAAASVIKAKGSDDTVLGLMLKDLGCINIADGSDLLEDLSLEKIIQEDPDMIFITEQGSDHEGTEKALKEALTGSPAWAGLTAVKENKVHYMDKALYHLKPNDRWAEAYEKLEKLIYEQ